MPTIPRHGSGLRAIMFGTLVTLLMGVRAPEPTRHKQVLLFYDEDKALPGLAILDKSLRSTFNAEYGTDIVFFTESMNLSQFSDEHYEEVLRDYYLKKYRDVSLDLIVGVMGPTLGFLVRNSDAFQVCR